MHDLARFAQFKKREKHPSRSYTSNTHPWLLFTLCKWHQVVQSVTIKSICRQREYNETLRSKLCWALDNLFWVNTRYLEKYEYLKVLLLKNINNIYLDKVFIDLLDELFIKRYRKIRQIFLKRVAFVLASGGQWLNVQSKSKLLFQIHDSEIYIIINVYIYAFCTKRHFRLCFGITLRWFAIDPSCSGYSDFHF